MNKKGIFGLDISPSVLIAIIGVLIFFGVLLYIIFFGVIGKIGGPYG